MESEFGHEPLEGLTTGPGSPQLQPGTGYFLDDPRKGADRVVQSLARRQSQQEALVLQQVLPLWSDETLAWGVRALLRAAPPAQRWPAVARLIGWMSPNELRDPAWAYWKARMLKASHPAGSPQAAQAQSLFQGLASPRITNSCAIEAASSAKRDSTP